MMTPIAFLAYFSVSLSLLLLISPIAESAWWPSGGKVLKQQQSEYSPPEHEQRWSDWMPHWSQDDEWSRMNAEPSLWNLAMHPSQMARISALKTLNAGIRTKMTKGFYLAALDVPGFTARDIHARINSNEYGCRIDIHGSKTCAADDPVCFERSIDTFVRLPADADCPSRVTEKMSNLDVEKVQVGVENGVLHIRVARGEAKSFAEGIRVAVSDSWDYLSSAGLKAREAGKEGLESASSVVGQATDVVKRAGEDISATATSVVDKVANQAGQATQAAKDSAGDATEAVKSQASVATKEMGSEDETVVKVRETIPGFS